MNMPKIAAVLGLAAAAFTPALAHSEHEADAPELSGYVRTGQTEACLTARNIESMQILNRHQILVKMRSGSDYLNEPNCNLNKNYALKYEVTVGQICNTTIVTLVDSGAPMSTMGSCGLEKFEKLDKKTASN